MQKEKKIGRLEAIEIVERKQRPEKVVKDQKYERYVHMKVSREATRSICPFEMQKIFHNNSGMHKESITSIRDGYIVKAESDEQHNNIFLLTTIVGTSWEVSAINLTLRINNVTKGLVYVTECDVTRYTSFEERLKNKYNIGSVVQAFWIKKWNINATLFFITFAQSQLPSYITIPGELVKTKVYQYNPKPIFCNNCQEYSPTVKKCKNETRCRMYSGT